MKTMFVIPTEAHIAAGLLESEGIPVFLLGINHASMNWLIANALGGIQVQVPAKYAERAKQILADDRAIDEPNDCCPKCGSSDTSVASHSWRISFLAMHLLQLPLPWRKDRRSCCACGHGWREKHDA